MRRYHQIDRAAGRAAKRAALPPVLVIVRPSGGEQPRLAPFATEIDRVSRERRDAVRLPGANAVAADAMRRREAAPSACL